MGSYKYVYQCRNALIKREKASAYLQSSYLSGGLSWHRQVWCLQLLEGKEGLSHYSSQQLSHYSPTGSTVPLSFSATKWWDALWIWAQNITHCCWNLLEKNRLPLGIRPFKKKFTNNSLIFLLSLLHITSVWIFLGLKL